MTRLQFLGAPTIVSVCFFLFTAPSYGQAHTKGREVAPLTPKLKPGDYVWHPEVSPNGPLVVLVSIPDQLLFVYRNGVRIGRSTVSTGKPGKQTPTGVFKAPKGPVSIIISNADRAAYEYRNGIEIGRVPINAVRLSGSYVYTALDAVDANGQREWISTASSRGRAPNLKEVANQLGIPPGTNSRKKAQKAQKGNKKEAIVGLFPFRINNPKNLPFFAFFAPFCGYSHLVPSEIGMHLQPGTGL